MGAGFVPLWRCTSGTGLRGCLRGAIAKERLLVRSRQPVLRAASEFAVAIAGGDFGV
jgi:hypothetical protein